MCRSEVEGSQQQSTDWPTRMYPVFLESPHVSGSDHRQNYGLTPVTRAYGRASKPGHKTNLIVVTTAVLQASRQQTDRRMEGCSLTLLKQPIRHPVRCLPLLQWTSMGWLFGSGRKVAAANKKRQHGVQAHFLSCHLCRAPRVID